MAGEFELIARWFDRPPRRPDIRLGIGDDAALLAPSGEQHWAVTVDTLVEGVHFPQDTDPVSIGHKALAVNLSDLAAMGAAPAWATLALSLPRADEAWLQGFSAGFFALAERHALDLIGGDTTRGALSITVQVCGQVPPGQALRRSGARPGDAVYVTGTLGDAGLALAWLQGKRALPEADGRRLRRRLDRPTPRIEAGVALRGLATAAIDISDGLLADLSHVLAASGVGARVERERLPLSPTLRAQADGADWALGSGDDYELLFTAPPRNESAIGERLRRLELPFTRIGYIEAAPGLRLVDAQGRLLPLPAASGYDHFRDAI